jgi:DNA-binding response OmpR family regulator
MLLKGLATRGHSARWFRNGAVAAVALAGPAREITARVVVLDHDLPGLDGPAVLGRLVEAGVLAGSRVIVLAATGDQANARAALTTGAFDHLAKPGGPQALLRSIRLALRNADRSPVKVYPKGREDHLPAVVAPLTA